MHQICDQVEISIGQTGTVVRVHMQRSPGNSLRPIGGALHPPAGGLSPEPALSRLEAGGVAPTLPDLL